MPPARGQAEGLGQPERQKFFSGPCSWDMRAQFEGALGMLGIKYAYVEASIQMAGMQHRGVAAAAVIIAGLIALSACALVVLFVRELPVALLGCVGVVRLTGHWVSWRRRAVLLPAGRLRKPA